MPPALHPRSSMTLSLFTSTLAISFLVVGLPHLIPCPVQPQAYADDGTPIPRRRRRREVDSEGENGEANVMRDQPVSRERECPVPKPTGLVGQILGVKKMEAREGPVVRIEKFDPRVRRIGGAQGDGKG